MASKFSRFGRIHRAEKMATLNQPDYSYDEKKAVQKRPNKNK
jgi:hypothetical protein